jgi:phosphoribosyl 1,2-cyclic phosphodiesterase
MDTRQAEDEDMAMTLRFWGVRGSLAAPGHATSGYGGHTSCVELRCGRHLIILDLGTGARPLGQALSREAGRTGVPVVADVLLTHLHLDHVIGLPFFAPLYEPHTTLRFWAGHLGADGDLEAALSPCWKAPLMPDIHSSFAAERRFHCFAAGERVTLHPDLAVDTIKLNHPGGATGYRFTWGGRTYCHITDHEHGVTATDQALRRFVMDTDMMTYDASYTEAQYPARRGWGHSTWQKAVELAQQANVGRLVLFHHDPDHDDATLDAITAEANTHHPGTVAAREGWMVRV